MTRRLSLTCFIGTAFAVAVVSCQNGQTGGNSGGGDSPYVANFGSDGGYNPYPGHPGNVEAPSGGAGQAPTYTRPPEPPAQDQYAFTPAASSTPASSPRPSTAAPKKKTATTASRSGAKSKTPTSKPKSAAKSTAKAKAPAKKGGGSHKVAGGDTLYGIAIKRGTTVAKLKAANNLKTDVIRPGQVLKLP